MFMYFRASLDFSPLGDSLLPDIFDLFLMGSCTIGTLRWLGMCWGCEERTWAVCGIMGIC